MARRSAVSLTAEAAGAQTPEQRLAALVTLEAIQPDGILGHPETVMTLAEAVDGAPLAAELDEFAGRSGTQREPE